ncbi:hypothetical protein V5O48_016331 [Marasmius crinis-equi]|uniref:DUF6533 domain-containing protein n=1 Tax=Marasmius crinis-equi TaxID=585013 RepID=A0ABR3ES31_9AGAR
MPSGQLVDPVEDFRLYFITNCVGFAGFTVLIWDHIDTFATEVEHIWLGPKGPITYLFLLNRYLTPLGFMVNLFAYLSPVWDTETFVLLCRHFIRYEGSMTLIGIDTVGLMMLLRVYALYKNQFKIVVGVASLLALQFGINAWLLTKGIPVAHTNRNIHACTMIFDAKNNLESILASSTAWLPLVYDTVAFGLTFYRTYPSVRGQSRSKIARRLLEDGLLYYSVIFSVTLVLTLMIIFAPDGLKNVAAQLELLITVTMMSRITLNLKKFSRDESHSNGSLAWPSSTTASKMIPQFFKRPKKYDTFGEVTVSTAPTFSRWGVPDTDTVELRTMGHVETPEDEQRSLRLDTYDKDRKADPVLGEGRFRV